METKNHIKRNRYENAPIDFTFTLINSLGTAFCLSYLDKVNISQNTYTGETPLL